MLPKKQPKEGTLPAVDKVSLLPLPNDSPDVCSGEGQRWFAVVADPYVIVRSMPMHRCAGVCTAAYGEVLEVDDVKNGWARLSMLESAKRGVCVEHDDEGWVQIDGRPEGGILCLHPVLPRWFRVVAQPWIPLWSRPPWSTGKRIKASVVAEVEADDVVEVIEIKAGWVRLHPEELVKREIPEEVPAAWALLHGGDEGIGLLPPGQLLEPCFVPCRPAGKSRTSPPAECEDATQSSKDGTFEGLRAGLRNGLARNTDRDRQFRIDRAYDWEGAAVKLFPDEPSEEVQALVPVTSMFCMIEVAPFFPLQVRPETPSRLQINLTDSDEPVTSFAYGFVWGAPPPTSITLLRDDRRSGGGDICLEPGASIVPTSRNSTVSTLDLAFKELEKDYWGIAAMERKVEQEETPIPDLVVFI